MSAMEYIELRAHAQSAFNGARPWRDEAYATWRCRCSAPKPDVHGPINAVIMNPKRRMTVDFIFGFSGFRIAAVRLVRVLGERRVASLFHVGTVRASDGKLVSNFVTLRAKRGPVYIRGDENSPRRLCPDCGRLVLLATGQAYLCGLDRKAAILQSSFGSLLVRRDVFDSTLRGAVLPHVKLRRLEVRNSSADGLPVPIDDAVRLLRNGERRGRSGK